MILKPRYYQAESVKAFFDYTADHWGKHPIIVLPTGCISGDTIINENRATLGRKKTIKQIYNGFNRLNKHQKHNYNQNIKTFVRSFNGATIQLNEVESVSYSGIQELLLLELENNFSLKATYDHQIMTKRGWIKMKNLTTDDYVMCDNLKASKNKALKLKTKKSDLFIWNLWYHPYAKTVKTKKEKRGYSKRIELHRFIYEAKLNNLNYDEYKYILRNNPKKSKKLKYIDPSKFDIHHKDDDHYNNNIKNLIKLTKKKHQQLHSIKNRFNFNQGIPYFVKVKSLSYYGFGETYDIGCYVNHNFVANGIIIHNSGKSLVQAMIVEELLRHDHTRILLLTHQAELIKQNYIELTDNLEDRLLDTGVYCAGLRCRDTRNRIIFASIQSVYERAWELGFFDLILVDECHRIPQEKFGTYRFFLDEMIKINKNVVIGGLSATPFRMKSGLLCDGKDKIFDDICHTTTIPELIDAGHFKNKDHKQYLCEIISKNGINKANMKKVHIHGGEYVAREMEEAFRKGDLVERTVTEIKDIFVDRKKILVFTTGIKHCEEVTEKLNQLQLNAEFIHSKQNKKRNDEIISEFKKGNIRCLVNIDILTTGFNEKTIDGIAMIRSTLSPGLYYQIAGRGLRMHPDKENCLYGDFGGNILYHGPIDKIEIKKNKSGKREVTTCPMKECPECHQLLFLAVMICPSCGHDFSKDEYKHEDKASEADILSKWKKPYEYDIVNVTYTRHSKPGKPDSLKVSYYYNEYLQCWDHYVCIEHDGFVKQKAIQWFKKVTNENITSVSEALSKSNSFRKPIKILVDFNGKYPKIISFTYNTNLTDVDTNNTNMKWDNELQKFVNK